MFQIASDELLPRIRKSQPLTRLILLGLLIYLLSIPILQRGISRNDASIVLGWIGFTLLLEAALAVSALLLMRHGQKNNLRQLAWGGAFVIAAGIWSDVLATVVNTPDMAREGNPIIIFLRESGFSLWLQYLTGFTAQFLLTVISCALWVAFIRHVPLYKALLLAMHPQSLIEFMWAALGGRTYFSKIEKIKISRSYRLMWWLVLPLIMPFGRFSAALEWMKVIPHASFLIPLIVLLQSGFSLVLLFGWLFYTYLENRASLRSDPVFTRRANQANLKEALVRLSLLVVATCACACLSGFSYLWVTREPEYLDVRVTEAPETVTMYAPFPIKFTIQNIGAKEAALSSIQATVWKPDEKTVSEKLLFVLAMPQPMAETQNGPQTTLKYENVVLLPDETLQVELWFAGIQPGDVLIKTSVYSGLREKIIAPVPIHISPP